MPALPRLSRTGYGGRPDCCMTTIGGRAATRACVPLRVLVLVLVLAARRVVLQPEVVLLPVVGLLLRDCLGLGLLDYLFAVRAEFEASHDRLLVALAVGHHVRVVVD